MDEEKRLIAAVTAVLHYIRTEQEALARQAAGPPGKQVGPPPMVFKPWSLSGRQAQMQMRNLMQMRNFHGAKFR
ncbi:MAG: hypothetical protein JSW39_30030 [Desulfobacterales bacterium]|nr:MAG: hypothetical protein JSW39_30030 [Desulfobacterales bacterium]